MLKGIIRQCAKISAFFHWDLLFQISRRISRSDRLLLALRLLQDEVKHYTIRRDNLTWTAYGWDLHMCWPLFEHGLFQGDQIQAITSWIIANDRVKSNRNIIVDVGANIGTTSIPFVKNLNCQVLAIEPFPENFLMLNHNVMQNGLNKQIAGVQSAIALKNGTVKMTMPKKESGSASVYQKTPQALQNHPKIDVPAAKLMDILTSARISPEQVAFVWSDTEGSEAKVIKTGVPLWQIGVPLYVEVFPRLLERQGSISDFKYLVMKYFDWFIPIKSLIGTGVDVDKLPISQFLGLVDYLKKKHDLTDVLLLPKGFDSSD